MLLHCKLYNKNWVVSLAMFFSMVWCDPRLQHQNSTSFIHSTWYNGVLLSVFQEQLGFPYTEYQVYVKSASMVICSFQIFVSTLMGNSVWVLKCDKRGHNNNGMLYGMEHKSTLFMYASGRLQVMHWHLYSPWYGIGRMYSKVRKTYLRPHCESYRGYMTHVVFHILYV